MVIRAIVLIIALCFVGQAYAAFYVVKQSAGKVLAKSILKQAGGEATKRAMKELGLGSNDTALIEAALANLKDEINQNFEDTKNRMERYEQNRQKGLVMDKLTALNNLSVKLDNLKCGYIAKRNERPSSEDAYQFMEDTRKAIVDADNVIGKDSSGYIGFLVANDKEPAVSNLYDFWKELDNERSTFAVYYARALAAVESMEDFMINGWQGTCSNDQYGRLVLRQTGASQKSGPSWQDVHSTACRTHDKTRTGDRHDGGPDDPKSAGNNNEYFELGTNVSSLADCKSRCENKGFSACKGVEYNDKTRRCELWKQTIGHRKPSNGYGCHSMQPPEVQPGFDPIAFIAFRSAIREATTNLYRHGVPLVEASANPYFVHVKGQDWALGAPVRPQFSGYFNTSVDDRIIGKLRIIRSNYKPSEHRNKTLEQYLTELRIPTKYVDQKTWECVRIGGVSTQGDAESHALKVAAHMVLGNEVKSSNIVLSYTREPLSACQNRLNTMKAEAGRNYQVRNGQLYGGLMVRDYYYAKYDCADLDICDGPSDYRPANWQIFGRYYAYNLSGYDTDAHCRSNSASLQCRYGHGKPGWNFNFPKAPKNRMNLGGRAALTSDLAIQDYFLRNQQIAY